jgi:Xaa-Pro dipeptidase
LIKSAAEIALLRYAAHLADIGMRAAIETAGPGVNERDCAAALYAAVIKAGADSMRSALIASGSRTASFHGRLGHHVLARGDMLHVESIPLVQGYGARLMRSTVIGDASVELSRAAEQLIRLQEKQFEAMKPGAHAAEVDAVLRSSVLASGLRDDYRNITGYTLGFIGLPVTSDFTRVFRPDADWVLEPDMVFHMYTSAAGMAFSDTLLVTEKGSERLTRTERRLYVRGQA